MIRIALVSVLLHLAAPVVWAQPVPVQSGEHETFSRLVFRLQSGTDWSINRLDHQAQINVAQPDIEFDLSQVFDKIPRKRLIGVSQKEKGAPLDLALSCNCEVEGFVQSGSYLVIDIRDAKTPAFRFGPGSLPRDLAAYRFQLGEGVALPDRRIALDERRNETVTSAGTKQPALGVATATNLPEQRLLAQIQRAASQGLLTPVVELKPQDAPPPSVETQPAVAPARSESNMAMMTVIDRDLATVAGALNQLAPAHECLSDDLVSVPSWADERPFSDQIGALRAELFGEFDQPDAEIATELAKTYIHFGFGAEAKAVLDLIADSDQGADVLPVLADIMDAHPVKAANPLRGQSSCSANHALWSTLAGPVQKEEIEGEAVLQSFVHLPRHLRQQLGPRLGRQFNALGDHDLAGAILRAIDRSTDSSGPAHDLAEAEIEDAQGNTEAAVARIETVVASDSDVSPEALIKLVDLHYAEGKALQPDMPELAASYAAEHRMGDMGPELRRVHAMSLAMTRRFDQAFEVLDMISDEEMARAALHPVLELLTESADDVTFLTFALPVGQAGAGTLAAPLETSLAKRLLDLGFPEQAFAILEQGKSRNLSVADRLLRAEIALANELPHRAMIEVLNVSTPEAADIRARAMRANGDYETAGQVLLEAERPEIAARNLWLGEAWDRSADTQEPRYGRLAQLSSQLAGQVEPEGALPPLASARSLLDESVSARSGIDEILGVLQVTDTAE